MTNNNLQIKKSFNNPDGQGFSRRVEITGAIVIIFLMSFLIAGNLLAGFILPLFIVIAVVSFLISFVFPRSGVYSIIFLTFIWERFFTLAPIFIDRQEYKIYSLDIILGAIFLGIAFQVLSSFVKNKEKFKVLRKQFLQQKKVLQYFTVFIILVGMHFVIDITLKHGTNKSLAFSSFKYYSFYPMLYLTTIILFVNKEDIKVLFKFALVGGLGIIFFIIYGILNQGALWAEFTPMSTSGIRILAFTHSFYLTMIWLGLFLFIVLKKKTEKKFYWLLGIFTLGILGSMMRHLWLGLGLSCSLVFFFYFKKENRQFVFEKIKFYLPGGIAVLIVIIYLGTAFPYSSLNNFTSGVSGVIYERVASLGQIQGDSSFSWRGLAWRETFEQLIHQPVYGLGFGRSIYLETANYHDFVEVRNIHNSWLVLVAQLGLVIGTVACLFFVSIFKSILKITKQKTSWVELTVVVLLFNYIFVALFQPYLETNMLGIFFWILLGLITSFSSKESIEKYLNDKTQIKNCSEEEWENTSIKKITIGRITFKK